MTASGGNKQFKNALELGARYTITLLGGGLLELKGLKFRETQQLTMDAAIELIISQSKE